MIHLSWICWYEQFCKYLVSTKIIKFETAVKKVKNSDAYLGRYGVAKQLTGPLVSLGFQMVLTLKSCIEANLIYNRKTYL